MGVTWSSCRFGKEAGGWAVCQTHLIIYWVKEAEENWALEKLPPWYQMYRREGDAWKTFKDCVWNLVENGAERQGGEWAGPGHQTAHGDAKGAISVQVARWPRPQALQPNTSSLEFPSPQES